MMDARVAALAVVAECSSSGMRASRGVEPILRAHCTEPPTTSELRRRAAGLKCAIPPDGRMVAIRGRLDRVIHGRERDLVVAEIERCETP